MNDVEVIGSLHAGQGSQGWKTYIIQSIFVLLGVGILVPWNAFISAKDYFDSRLCNLSVGSNVESVFAAVFNLSSVVSMGLVILVQWSRDHRFAGSNEDEVSFTSPTLSEVTALERSHDSTVISSRTRPSSADGSSILLVMIPLALSLAVFLAQSSMVLMLNIPPVSFEGVTILCLGLCGVCISIGSAGIVATAGRFNPTTAMNPYLAGQSLGGVIVSMANFMAAAWEDPTSFCNNDVGPTEPSTIQGTTSCKEYTRVAWSVFCYFLSGSFVLLACIFGYLHVHRVQVTESRNYDYETVQGETLATDDAVERSPRMGLELHHRHVSHPESSTRVVTRSTSDSEPRARSDDCDDRNPSIDLDSHEAHEVASETLQISRLIKGPATCIFLTFFVTLSLFPGLTSSLQSVRRCHIDFRLSNDLFTPFTFVLFNVGDFTGRVVYPLLPLASIPNLSEKLVVASLLRFLFFPLLLLCTSRSPTTPSFVRWHIPSDLYSIVVQFAFAFTNGSLVTAAFVHAPTLVPPASTSAHERMSEILQFALAFGLLTGSFFSFAVSNVAS